MNNWWFFVIISVALALVLWLLHPFAAAFSRMESSMPGGEQTVHEQRR